MPLIAAGHRTIVPDLPGFGLSEKHRGWDYSVEAQADAIRSLILQLEIDRLAIVCHDFGALVASELIARDPGICTHLVILNTSLRSGSWSGGVSPLSLLRVPLLGELALALSRQWMLKLAMGIYVGRRQRLTPDVMRHYWWPFQHGYKNTLLSMSRGHTTAGSDFARWRACLNQLTVPCLIVWGACDPTFTLAEADDLHRLIPTSRLEILENANHFVPEDRPLATGRLIRAFISGTL